MNYTDTKYPNMELKQAPIKGILLSRVSTKRQEDEGLSLNKQTERLEEYASQHDIEIVEKFVFHETAGQKIRKKFDEMVEFIRNNPEVKAIVAFKVDRMTRNFRDAVMIDELRNLYDIELHFVEDRLVLNKASRSHEMQNWELKVFLAKQYLNDLHDYGVDTWKTKVKNGEWSGTAPCGYMNVTLPDKRKSIILDPQRAPLVKKAFEMYARGQHSIDLLAKYLRKLGLTANAKSSLPISRAQVAAMLDNPFYYGVMDFKGQKHPHHYEPLISKWLFDKCQQVKESWNKKPFKYGAKDFAFKGIIQCEHCKHTLSSYVKKEITYVRCHHCKAVHFKEEDLLEQVGPLFESMKPPDDVIEDMKQELKKSFENENEFYTTNIVRINAEIKKNANRMEQMYLDRLDGSITHENYDKLVVRFKRIEADLMEELKSHQSADETFMVTSSYLLELAHRATDLFQNSQPARKRQLLKLVLANCQMEGQNLVFNLKSIFQRFVVANETGKWLPRLDSNQRPSD